MSGDVGNEYPLVSVVVPIYNVENYLKRCVDSILEQSYNKIEIILVDDGSTDTCPKICDEYKALDNRIIVIHKTNGGLSDARNAGIEIATGEFFIFVDSDDYITKNTIENMVFSCLNNMCDIAICNMIRFYDDGTKEPFYYPTSEELVYTGDEKYNTLNQPSACNKLFKSYLFNCIRFPKGKYYEDTFVYHELLFKAKGVVLTGTDDYWYFLRKNSILGEQRYTEKYFDFIEAVYNRASFLKKNNVIEFAKEAFLSLYAAMYNIQKCVICNKENEYKFSIAYKQYNEMYSLFVSNSSYRFEIKQKIRFLFLRYFPNLHKKMF